MNEAKVEVVKLAVTKNLPKPTKNVDRVKADIAEFGYGILQDVLSPGEAREIRGVLSAEIEKEERAGALRESYTDRDAKNRRLRVIADRHKWFQDLLEHPVALALARHMLGPTYLDESYLVHSWGANVTRPGSTDMGIHGDQDYVIPYLNLSLQSRQIWCLDDFDDEVGATRMVPKSHLWGHNPIKDGTVVYESVPAEAPAGSLLVYDNRTYHGTGANRSTSRERPALIAGYTPPHLRPMVYWPSVLNPAAMKSASETVRLLLGYGRVTLGFDQPWLHALPEVEALSIGDRRTIEEKRGAVRPKNPVASQG
jgi:ectoine hydroxylase-related dioxygenase (phytanoyl-CoA dioxygenase family)